MINSLIVLILFTVLSFSATAEENTMSEDAIREMATDTIMICLTYQRDRCTEIKVPQDIITPSLGVGMYFSIGSKEFSTSRDVEKQMNRDALEETFRSEGFEVVRQRDVPDVWYLSKES